MSDFNEAMGSPVQKSSLMDVPKTVAAPPPVSTALDTLSNEVDMLSDAVERLFNQVSPVLGPDMTTPEPLESEKTRDDNYSDITNYINRLGRSVNRIRTTVVNTRNRLEI